MVIGSSFNKLLKRRQAHEIKKKIQIPPVEMFPSAGALIFIVFSNLTSLSNIKSLRREMNKVIIFS